MKISFIGCGNMGEAIVSALLSCGLARPDEITASEPDPKRCRYLSETYSIAVTADNAAAVRAAEVMILAVKPQQLPDIITELKGKLTPEQLLISILAGVNLSTLTEGFGHQAIVRAMPNTPAQIGRGVTAWTASDAVSTAQKETAAAILGAMGREVFFAEERYLDMATAVSGSGPAYFFLFAEALAEAGTGLGLPAETALDMALETMLGAAYLMKESGKTPAQLRQMVTSKGGTTERALATFEEGKLRQAVQRAVQAAYDRARELGGR